MNKRVFCHQMMSITVTPISDDNTTLLLLQLHLMKCMRSETQHIKYQNMAHQI